MLLGPGSLVAGRYVVERKIGEGSWGEVWQGRHAHVGMKVAIKALLDAKALEHDAIVRFKREAKFLGRIQSDYVARVLDFLSDPVYGLILIMEFVEGESVADLLDAGPFTVERAIDVGCDLVAGLCDLHAARIIHRDLKPANILLRPLPEGRVRATIIDFSLGRFMAKPGEEEPSITQLTGAFMSVGTLPYMAPEQVLDSRKVTEASDLYAVGAILYRCVAGRYVFEDADHSAGARKKVSMEAPRLSTGRTDALARGLEDVIARALRRRPEERYPDARSMLKELSALKGLKSSPDVGAGATEAPTISHSPAQTGAPTVAVDEPTHQEPSHAGGRSISTLLLGAATMLLVGTALGLGVARWRGDHASGSTPALTAPPPPPPSASSVLPAAASSRSLDEITEAETVPEPDASAAEGPPARVDAAAPAWMRWPKPAPSTTASAAPPSPSASASGPGSSTAPATTRAKPPASAWTSTNPY